MEEDWGIGGLGGLGAFWNVVFSYEMKVIVQCSEVGKFRGHTTLFGHVCN